MALINTPAVVINYPTPLSTTNMPSHDGNQFVGYIVSVPIPIPPVVESPHFIWSL